ncbi:hypothetical protein K437DRAFT_275638 [Tilletiaria anomala UBC 951]|uniref:BTB domain-containing protein n=1 Tax=Tilletiaria anomala (strain ATCC 24038 / CBS 436.72 / UBC 951) TaxID=1037660 RepID=A0A066VPV3_TILAU|nr:uncharacterized protein K437DRAFT_275638 [Tilletiaria anomala UBC 951]KDN40794.1 hypothetical protein K437DRAFT_275638 [Tilletiaria anomala UBC 951]
MGGACGEHEQTMSTAASARASSLGLSGSGLAIALPSDASPQMHGYSKEYSQNGHENGNRAENGLSFSTDALTRNSLLGAQVDATNTWRRDLKTLYTRASERFADVCWATDASLSDVDKNRSPRSLRGPPGSGGGHAEGASEDMADADQCALERRGSGNRTGTSASLMSFGNTSIALGRDAKGRNLIFAHKALIYARAPNTFQTKYLHLKTPAAQIGSQAANASEFSLPNIRTYDVDSTGGPAAAPIQNSADTPTLSNSVSAANYSGPGAARRKSAPRSAYPPSSFPLQRFGSGKGARSASTGGSNGSESEGESVSAVTLLSGRRISAPRSIGSRRSSVGSATSINDKAKSRESLASGVRNTRWEGANSADASDAEEFSGGSLRSKLRPQERSAPFGNASSVEVDAADRLSIASSSFSFSGSVISDASSVHTIGRSPYLPRRAYKPGPSHPIYLDGASTSAGFLEAILEYLYTGEESMQQAFEFLYEEKDALMGSGLGDGSGSGIGGREERLEKLQQDLTYMWRSKLFSDIKIVLDDSAFPITGPPMRSIPDTMSALSLPMNMEEDPEDEVTSFSAHRFILASRSSYFASQLLSPFADARAPVIHLPSPPFTPAALHFALGFIYSGTLSFSNRSFDLATAFQLWRAGAYLQLDTLQSVVSALIANEFCHGFICSTGPPLLASSRAVHTIRDGAPCKNCARRVPRTLAFASCHDVNDTYLLHSARRAVSGPHFGTYWNKDIGNLDYNARSAIVDAVCGMLEQAPVACIGAVRQLALVSSRVEAERFVAWVEALRWMMERVEAKLKETLEAQLEKIVEDDVWKDLTLYTDFNSDVLEKLLLLLVDSLTEKRCALAYQILVGSVLLREEDPPKGQKRQTIEDARAGIIRYIKRRWISVRAKAGFDGLENWALKEISDEIDVKVDDLISTNELEAEGPRSRTGLKATVPAAAPQTRAAGTSATMSGMTRPSGASSRPVVREGEREAGPINLRAAAMNRSAARAVSTPGTSGAAEAPAPGTRTTSLSRTAAAPRALEASRFAPPTQSTSARVGTRSPTSPKLLLPTPSSNTASSTARRPSKSSVASTALSTSAAPHRPAAPSVTSTKSTSSATLSTASTTAELRKRAPSSLSIKSSSASIRSTCTVENGPKSAPLRSNTEQTPKKCVANGRTAVGSDNHAASPTPRPAAKMRNATQNGWNATESAKRTPTQSVKTMCSMGSLRSTAAASKAVTVPPLPKKVTQGSQYGASSGPDQDTIKKSSKRPQKLSEDGTQRARPAASSGPALTDTTFTPVPPSPLLSSDSKGREGSALAPSAHDSNDQDIEVRPMKRTCLAHGIPCVVAPNQASTRKPPRFRALVKYIGPLPGHPGSWLGVQIPPPLPPALESDGSLGIESIKTDGTLDGIRYFDLTASTCQSGSEPAPTSDSEIDEETRLHRERRRKRLQDLLARSSEGLDAGSAFGERTKTPALGSDLHWRRRQDARSRSPSFAACIDINSEDSLGFFIRPEDVLWVVMPGD